jgi:hypothetical protein
VDWFNLIAGIASILGLIVSMYTLYKVMTLPTALKEYSRNRQLTELIDKIIRIPLTREVIPTSTVREIEFILSTIRTYYVSRRLFGQQPLKTLLENLENELRGEKRLVIIQNQLRLIRDEITIR